MADKNFNSLGLSIVPKGIVTLVKSNAETGEEIERITKCNVVTDRAMYLMFAASRIGNYIGISSSTATPDRRDYTVDNTYVFGYTQSGITSPIFIEESGVDPMYGEWQQRFNPPNSGTRNINTITLSDTNTISSGNSTANCYVKLDATCVQADNEIIDIFIEFSSCTTTLKA